MNDSEKQSLINEARHFYLASPVILPLLEKMKRVAFERLLQKHASGDAKYDTIVSELSVLSNLEREIKSKSQYYEEIKNEPTRE